MCLCACFSVSLRPSFVLTLSNSSPRGKHDSKTLTANRIDSLQYQTLIQSNSRKLKNEEMFLTLSILNPFSFFFLSFSPPVPILFLWVPAATKKYKTNFSKIVHSFTILNLCSPPTSLQDCMKALFPTLIIFPIHHQSLHYYYYYYYYDHPSL